MNDVLCIIQARMGSRRLPGKVLMGVHGVPLIERVWVACCEAFGESSVVVAYPDTAENAPLVNFLDAIGALRFGWDGPEWDVLGRFYAAACGVGFGNNYGNKVMRVCADNPFLSPYKLWSTSGRARYSRREGGERFTVAQLHAAQRDTPLNDPRREHVTQCIVDYIQPPKAPAREWSIDTQDDLDRCNALRSYVFDLDGTLCISPGFPLPSMPRTDIIAKLNALYDAGHRIHIETSRRASLRTITEEQLAAWNVQYDTLRCGVKKPAHVYVDDLSIRPEEL